MATKLNINEPVRVDRPTHLFSENASALRAYHPSKHQVDEMILTLANEYENKRARQVFEWERAQVLRLKRSA